MRSRFVITFVTLVVLSSGCFAIFQPTDSVIETTATVVSTQPTLLSPSPNAPQWDYTPTLPNDFPNLTPIPTLSVSQQADLIQLLKFDTCNLPCYLGIEPGKTTFDEAEKIITDLGGTLRADYKNFFEGQPEKPPLRLRRYIFDVNSLFYVNLGISGENDEVQQIVFDALGNSQPLFYKAWGKYSIESIFKNYGEPDQILIYAGERYDIRVVYLNYGMILDWSIPQNDNYFDHKLCPQFSAGNVVNLMIAVADTKGPFEIVPSSFMGLEWMWRSTQETLGISEKEFFDKIMSDDNVCFDVIAQ